MTDRELLEKIMGAITDLQQSQLKMSGEVRDIKNNTELMKVVLQQIDKRLIKVEVSLVKIESTQNSLIERVLKIEQRLDND